MASFPTAVSFPTPWSHIVSTNEETHLTPLVSPRAIQRGTENNYVHAQQRAKQQLSFICSWTACRRAFGKLEHLQRHERSHAGDARYECPICERRFVRSDVLRRHTAIHKQTSFVMKKTRNVSCISCTTLKVRCDGPPTTSCLRCQALKQACVYMNTEKSSLLSHESAISGVSSVHLPPPNSATLSNCQASRDNTAPPIGIDIPSTVLDPNSSFSIHAAYRSLEGESTICSLLPASYDFSNLPLEPLYGFIMDSSESYFGWEIGDTELEHMKTLNTHAPHTPPANYFPVDAQNSTVLSTPTWECERDPPSRTPLSAPARTWDSPPVDSPWPHVYEPSVEDSQLDLPSVLRRSRPTLHEPHLDHIGDSIREAMLSLVKASHQPQCPVIDVAAFPSTQTLSICINLYFRHFHDTLPILRPSTFKVADAAPVLLLAMLAIGAMYSRDGLSGLAVSMNELARRAIVYLRDSDRRAMFDISIVQAWLLQSVFGLFCGSRMLYQHAEINRGGLVTAARRMHLLRPNISFVEELQKRKVTATSKEPCLACADDEERRRLGWGIYLYDMQISCLLSISPHFSIGEVNVALPSDDETWNAPASSTNFELDLLQPNKVSNFRQVVGTLLSSGKLPQPLNPFQFSLIAYTLYRLCTDACEYHWVFSQSGDLTDTPYLLAFSSNFKHNPQELLDQLSDSCYIVSCIPNALIVSVSALSHLGHIQFTWPGFLDNIKIAAGKSGTENSKRDSRLWLARQISQDQVNARAILVHAAQLNALLARFTFDAPSEAVWIFDTALTFWAIIKFGIELDNSSVQRNKTTITWSNSEVADDWIQNGGPASFQGVGDLGELSVSKILSVFCERLDNMPWGIAQRFRHVLTNLSKE